jgi:hypothetical protein
VPKKHEVQEEVYKMKNLQNKTSIEKDTTLNFLVWYNNRTKEAFLMHVTAVLDAMKKCGHFKDYKEDQKAYIEQKEVVNSAKASLALLDKAREGWGKLSKKSKKAKEAKAKSKEADGATKVPEDLMKANFQADLEKAKKAAEEAKGATTASANQQIRCLHSTPICFLSRASMHRTRLSSSRWKRTRMWIYKVSLRKAQGECPASCSTIPWCSTCSPCFPSTHQSKKSTSSRMYLKSPSASAYVSLYVE